MHIMNIRLSLFLLGGLLSSALWAQEANTVTIPQDQWTQGATFRYQVKTKLESDRFDEPQTSASEWVMKVDTVLWNGYRLRFYSPQGLQLYQFDPIIYNAMAGRLQNIEALPYAPPLVYITNKQGQIKEMVNLNYIASIYVPYYINLKLRVEREITSPTVRKEIVGLISQRLSEYGIQKTYDQFLGPIHAWYNQPLPQEGQLGKIVYSSPPEDPTTIPYAMRLKIAEDKPRYFVIERFDEIYMERAAEMMLDYLYGTYTSRGEKTTYMNMINTSDIDFRTKYTWKFDKKKGMVTAYSYEKYNHLQLITDIEPTDFHFRLELELK
ncbi:MAG TPA: hypothetical protein DCR93_04665 [Cytophagales bacterium]|nr:hypothetical protein [Cytophagales bacterium]HAP58815.1 hypothetical protein [Cytophagales bacterium]